VDRPPALEQWCAQMLGAPLATLLWESGHLSWVGAVRLADGREVVLKVRDPSPRLDGCHAVHAVAWRAGFPCPEPLAPPLRYDGLLATVERHLPGGRPGRWSDAELCGRTARELQRLVALLPAPGAVPTVDPPPPWTGWNDLRADPWPPPDEGPDLCEHPATRPLRELAVDLTARLRQSGLPYVLGHADWYQGNLRWDDDHLFAADDWDSVAALPEAALAGCAAVSFLPSPPGSLRGRPGAEVVDSDRFLTAYAAARDRPWSAEELEVAWAAGLWQRVFDAAKFLASGDEELAREQVRDAIERRRRAGC
jgi:hypothetical protein